MAARDVPSDIYGVVDLYGRTAQVTIASHVPDSKPTVETEVTVSNGRCEELNTTSFTGESLGFILYVCCYSMSTGHAAFKCGWFALFSELCTVALVSYWREISEVQPNYSHHFGTTILCKMAETLIKN